MKTKLLLAAAALATLALCGCSSTNITKLVNAMAKDPAIVSVSVTTIYGNMKLVRVGATTNRVVTVSPDGTVTVKGTEQ